MRCDCSSQNNLKNIRHARDAEFESRIFFMFLYMTDHAIHYFSDNLVDRAYTHFNPRTPFTFIIIVVIIK